MKPDHDDTLLDALLEEAFGGPAPPDLSARILEAWSRQQAAERLDPQLNGPPLNVYALAQDTALVVGDIVRPATNGVSPRTRRRQKTWPAVQLYASLAAAAAIVLLSYVGVRMTGSHNDVPVVIRPQPHRDKPPTVKPNSRDLAKSPAHNGVTPKVPDPTPRKVTPAPAAIAETPNKVPESPSAVVDVVKPRAPAASDAEVIAFINAELKEAWSQEKVSPSPQATDAEWCRRVFLRIVGRIPTVEELRAFTNDRTPKKHEQLVDRLLNEEPYAQEYARHWADVWTNVLVGRGLGNDPQDPASRDGLKQYLQASLSENKPYDRLALELLSATGAGQPTADNFNGAANFLLAHATSDGTVATARACRVFLGVQLQCVQCHDHPTAPLKQQSFWAMNGFFRQMKVIGNQNDPRELIDQDYLGYDGTDEEGRVIFEIPNGLMRVAWPEFLDGRQIARSGRVSEVNRRERFADLVVRSDYFSKAAVNRLWSHFLGFGFTRPVDDMVGANPPSHPELLDRVATEFAAHGHDLKRAMRWIALSDAFNRSSKVGPMQLVDMPEAGTTALFSRYYTRQLPAEEVIRSLQIAGQLRRDNAGRDIEQARVDWLAQARKTGDEEGAVNPELIQSSPLVRHATTNAFETMLHTVTKSTLPFDKKVEHLFLAALSRQPNREELAMAKNLAGVNEQNAAVALEDVWWALLNSNEFALDH